MEAYNMTEALIKREIRDLGDGTTEVIETYDLSHPDVPMELINDLIDDDNAFVTVVSTYLMDNEEMTVH